LVSPDAPKAAYQRRTTSEQESHFDLLKRLELSREDHLALVDRCRRRGVLFMSSPFDEESAGLLNALGVSVFKIPSGEVTNLPLLAYIAAFGKPMIVSTGMCTLGEVEAAVETIEGQGNSNFALLHCVSNYPANPADVNLVAMRTLASAFGVPIGYSDHTEGMEVSVASVAMGACVLEKHFTLDRTLPGPDHAASVEPDELTALVRAIRTVESAIGTGRKKAAASETDTANVARKSLIAAEDIAAGEELTEAVIAIRRPGTGLPPSMRSYLVSRTARRDIPAGKMLRLEDVA
jgi:sialic acid synthase SpsE